MHGEVESAATRQREKLPNGNLRVRVYAGTDPVTKRAHYLREIVPAGPKAEREADKVLTRLLNELDERRASKTSAPVKQLLKRYLDQHFEGEPSTRQQYRDYVRKHISPFIGDEPVGGSTPTSWIRCTPSCAGAGITARTSGA